VIIFVANSNAMSSKILIVDDERDICEILEFNLMNEGFEVACAHSAEEAMQKLTPEYDLILLDVMMGGMSGYKMAERLRTEGNPVPIIFLTAKGTENDMLTGFSVGGDDYIAKPFSIKEVVARTKAVIKRSRAKTGTGNHPCNRRLAFDDMVIDIENKEFSIGKDSVFLTKTEFEILVLLAENPNRIFSREDMIAKIWKEAPYITERTVDVHIARLRKKMGDYASVITNRSGYGYKFNASGL
jgi:DNA-binding response OmpR family regulator